MATIDELKTAQAGANLQRQFTAYQSAQNPQDIAAAPAQTFSVPKTSTQPLDPGTTGPGMVTKTASASNTVPGSAGPGPVTPAAGNIPATQTATPAATPGSTMPATVADLNTPQSQAIEAMYKAKQDAQLAQLKAAYEQSLSEQQAAAEKIPGIYQERANDLATQYERQHRNFHEEAAASGLNTGTGAQEELAFASNYGRDYGSIQKAQADAQAASDRAIADLGTNYQNQVSEALATGDYNKAAALLDEYNNEYQRQQQAEQLRKQWEQQEIENQFNQSKFDWQKQQQEIENQRQQQATEYQRQLDEYNKQVKEATTLASYGDFSLYAKLFGADQAAQAQAVWRAENPLLAYNVGNITADEYFRMTGTYPPGVLAAGAAAPSGGGYGGWRGTGGGGDSTEEAETPTGPTTRFMGSDLTADDISTMQANLGLPQTGVLDSKTAEAAATFIGNNGGLGTSVNGRGKTHSAAAGAIARAKQAKKNEELANAGYITDPVTEANFNAAKQKKTTTTKTTSATTSNLKNGAKTASTKKSSKKK